MRSSFVRTTSVLTATGLLASGALLTHPASLAAAEGKQTFSGEYTVTFLGLPVARSNFVSTFNGNSFTVQGRMSSAGIGKLFDSTTGTSLASGRFVGKQTRPESFRVQYKSGKKTQTTAISFAGGAVSKTVNDPPLRKRNNWIGVTRDQLQAVTDPISATLIRADAPGEVCSRVLKVYDGQMRMNLRLSHVSTAKVDGIDGDVVTCSARFVPIGGYRTTNRSIDYMRNRSKISISFAPLGETGIYAPVRATVGTTMGPVTVTARRTKS